MASRNASKYTEDGRFDDRRTSQFPAFERAMLQYANTCLDEWRDKAILTANSLVRARALINACLPNARFTLPARLWPRRRRLRAYLAPCY